MFTALPRSSEVLMAVQLACDVERLLQTFGTVVESFEPEDYPDDLLGPDKVRYMSACACACTCACCMCTCTTWAGSEPTHRVDRGPECARHAAKRATDLKARHGSGWKRRTGVGVAFGAFACPAARETSAGGPVSGDATTPGRAGGADGAARAAGAAACCARK